MLDFDFGRVRSFGFRRDTRDDVRDRIEGVVGAERPSIYETWLTGAGISSASERGRRRDVKGAKVKWSRLE